MDWRWYRFADLGVDNLHDALQLRSRVFILEQGPFLDIDGADRQSWHLLGRDESGTVTRAPSGSALRNSPLGRPGGLMAYLRIVDPGLKFAEPSIGRVVTALEVRRTGLGRALMREGLAGNARLWPGRANRIGAQARLQRFYEDLGFAVAGDEYLEDGIPHIEMLWSPA